jgi:hypothetical protein
MHRAAYFSGAILLFRKKEQLRLPALLMQGTRAVGKSLSSYWQVDPMAL